MTNKKPYICPNCGTMSEKKDHCYSKTPKILPMKEKCSCGESHISDRVVHRTNGLPCYVTDPQPLNNEKWEEKLIELLKLYRKDGSIQEIIFFVSQLLLSERADEREKVLNLLSEKMPKELVAEREYLNAEEKLMGAVFGKHFISKLEALWFNSALSEIKKVVESLKEDK